MGIEQILAVVGIVLGVLGVSAYMFSRRSTSGADGNRHAGLSEPEKKRRERAQSPSQQTPGATVPPPPLQPSQPPVGSSNSSTLAGGGLPDEDKILEEIDEWAEAEPETKEELTIDDGESDEEEESILHGDVGAIDIIPPLNPAIDDTQTMKAVTPKDTQEMKELIDQTPKELLPDEIIGWMDDLAEDNGDSFGDLVDLDDDESAPEWTIDTEYPDKKKQDVSATTAHFSAFYPKEAQAEQRYGVYIYAHAAAMLEHITNDANKFREELGGVVPQPRTAKASKTLAHGTKITVALESEEVEFEPDILTKRWHGDWTRYEFEFRPHADLIDETVFVRASIMIMGFEIAKIKFAIDIIQPEAQAMTTMIDDEIPSNPFARAKIESATTIGYDKIFISYSRKDKLIAEAFKVIQEAAGNDVFFDVDDIRTGEDWKAAIARAIDEADYLQLFWSEHSSTSEWCGYELDYALNYRCKENKCREFIRPVWWNAPMPPPPKSLGHLNFRRFDFEKLMRVDQD